MAVFQADFTAGSTIFFENIDWNALFLLLLLFKSYGDISLIISVWFFFLFVYASRPITFLSKDWVLNSTLY
jgi:hypothetical protein